MGVGWGAKHPAHATVRNGRTDAGGCGPGGAGVSKVQAAALRGWSLLLTTVPAGHLDSDFVETNIRVLAGLLHSDDVEVRMRL